MKNFHTLQGVCRKMNFYRGWRLYILQYFAGQKRLSYRSCLNPKICLRWKILKKSILETMLKPLIISKTRYGDTPEELVYPESYFNGITNQVSPFSLYCSRTVDYIL